MSPESHPAGGHMERPLALWRQLAPKEHKVSWTVRASFLDKDRRGVSGEGGHLLFSWGFGTDWGPQFWPPLFSHSFPRSKKVISFESRLSLKSRSRIALLNLPNQLFYKQRSAWPHGHLLESTRSPVALAGGVIHSLTLLTLGLTFPHWG